MNPIDAVKDWAQSKIAETELALLIKIDEEAAAVVLSRLITRNPDAKRIADYQGALTALKGSQ